MDEKTAHWYAEKYGEHPTNAKTVEIAELGVDDVVLDLGCGSGTAVREAAKRVTRGRVIGVDPSPAMVRIATEKTENTERVEFLEGSAAKLPLPGRSISVAIAINSLHHWEDVDAGLGELRRVLKSGGRLLVTEEDNRGRCGHGEGPLSDPKAVVTLLEDAGFEDVTLGRHKAAGEAMFVIEATWAGARTGR